MSFPLRVPEGVLCAASAASVADFAWWPLLNTASRLQGLPEGGAGERTETPVLTAALSTVTEKMVDHRTCAISKSYVIWSTSSQYQTQSPRASPRQSRLRGRHTGVASAPCLACGETVDRRACVPFVTYVLWSTHSRHQSAFRDFPEAMPT